MYDDLESSTHSDSRLFRIYSSVSRSLYFEDDEKYHENYGSILYQLGLWHFHGKVVPKDYGKALENFSEACCRFHCQEAIHFIDLDFDDTDKALYLKKCEMYAETADLLPHNMLCVYLESFYLENRFKIAHDYKNLHNYSKYLDGNQLGTIMKRLAYKYGSGDGIEKNIDQAVYWYQAASSQEYGFCHANAIHIAKLYATDSDFYDISKAIKYYTIAAENGFNQACLTLAQIYHYHDVAQNFSKALEYYEKTTSYIHYAKLGIGLLYEYGDGIDQDYDAAIDCYKESYDGGNPFASYHLGLMYFNGKGVVQNYRKAFELFTGTKSRIWKTMEKQQVVQVLETMCDDEKTERVYSYVNQNFIIGEANNYLRRMLYSGLGTPVPRYVETKGLGKRGNSSLF
jgi:TPR repeat protein